MFHSLTAFSHFCNDPSVFLQLNHKVSLTTETLQEVQLEHAVQDALGLVQGDLPMSWECDCSEAMTVIQQQLYGCKWRVNTVSKAPCLPAPVQIQPQFATIRSYPHLPIAYRKHSWLETSFVSLNSSAGLDNSIDSYSREERKQVSNKVFVMNNEKKKEEMKLWIL